jgi:ribosome biogenesis GTPase A
MANLSASTSTDDCIQSKHTRATIESSMFLRTSSHTHTNTFQARATSGALQTTGGRSLGADLVMKLLGNYCRNRDVKQSIRVGIVGYPNVGKSSLINSLAR